MNWDEGKWHADQVQAYVDKLSLSDDNLDVFCWNKKLSEYLWAGDNWGAIECFVNMNGLNVYYDVVTLLEVLAAVAGTDDLELGKQVHGIAVKSGLDLDVSVANSLINMYSKMGCVYFAREVFNDMKHLDLISWNSMISSCA